MPDVRMDSYHGEERRKAPRMPLCLVAAAELLETVREKWDRAFGEGRA